MTGPGDSRLYLLGSFHLLQPSDYPLSPDIDQAFTASQRVVFELSPQDMESPQLAQKMVQAAMRTDGSELKRDLDAIRSSGVAKVRGEWHLQVAGLAVPIRNSAGKVIASLSVSGPADRFKPQQMRVCVAAAEWGAEEFRKRLS